MDYSDLLEGVLHHLKGSGIECTALVGEPVTDEELVAAEAELKIRLPAELREFYQTIGDGLFLFWQSDPDNPQKPWGNFEIPKLSALAGIRADWRKLVLFTPEKAERYGFPHTKDPALAKRTAARMWHWLPLIEYGNGDSICLDLASPGCPVVFDKYDWMDGGSGENGHPLAPNWRAFLLCWGSVCFQHPEGLYWPWCFRPGGGVAWDSEQFRSPFRVTGLAELVVAPDPTI